MTLKSRIQEAFAEVPRPNDDAIFESDSEGAEDAFYDHRWDEVSVADLHYHTFALRAFSVVGFLYYLPAFLIASLENKRSGLADAVTDRLSPPKSEPRRPGYQRWWSHLSKEQRLCIIDFLEEFRSSNPEHYEFIITSLRRHVDS
jgi:hypothetical protein